MIELVFLFLLVAGVKKAWDDTKAAWRKSRSAYMTRADRNHPRMPKGKRAGHALRHDLGYGLSQVLRGFPQARHGFAAGWHQGRQAHAQARAGREKAKAEHLETRARLVPELREYRRRQREALEEIRRPEPGEGSEGTAGETPAGEEEEPEPRNLCWSCFVPEGEKHALYCATLEPLFAGDTDDPTYSYGLEDAAHHWPAANREQAGHQAQAASRDGRPRVVCEYPPGGGPGVTVARYVNGKEADSGDAGEGSPDDPSAPETETPTTEGTDMTSGDTTYAGVKTQMQAATAQAEQWQADATSAAQGSDEYVTEVQQAKTAAATMADEMQALEVDAASLGAMAEHLEALDAAEQAAIALQEAAQQVKDANDRVVESAQNVSSTLDASGHGALDEAHANAAGGGGKKEFYGD